MGSLTPIAHIFEALFSASNRRNPLIRQGLRRVSGCSPTLRYVGSRIWRISREMDTGGEDPT